MTHEERPEPRDAEALRRLAESTIAARDVALPSGAPASDQVRLIHELQVHQVELELQNDQLRLSRDDAETMRARYADLYESAPNGYLTVARDGRMSNANRAAARLLGREQGALLGKRLGTFVADADRAAFNDFLDEVFSHALAASTEVAIGNDVASARTVAVDGVRSTDLSEVRLSLTDVTERRRAEAALRLRDRAMRAVTQGIIITDPQQPGHPIVYVNAGFEAMTGYTAAEVAGRNCRFLQGRETDQAAVRALREAIEAERPVEVELLNYRRDGTPFWNALYITPVRDDRGTLVQFIGVLVDVTAQRATERALRDAQRLEVVGRLAGGIAHDFNNLLTVVLTNASLLQGDLEREDPRMGMAQAILTAGERAATLTHQLLAFSRSQMLDPLVLDVGATVYALSDTLRRLLPARVELTVSGNTASTYARVDATQFGQLLVHLALNARDALAEAGEVTIRTTLERVTTARYVGHEELPPREYVRLSVSDTGAGMDATTAAHAFDPFFSTKAVGKGSGLGLAMVHGFVKQSGGFVEIESAPGRGSTVSIYLPAMAAPAPAPSAAKPSAAGLRHETILIVEEDPSVRRLLNTVLSAQGYRLILCASAQSALESVAADAGTIDLVIVSASASETAGLEVIAGARRLRPQVKTLLLTDAADERSDGSDSITRLAKPFSPVALTRGVRAILDALQDEA